MRRFVSNRMASVLSILYLRCYRASPRRLLARSSRSFNSLFEMLKTGEIVVKDPGFTFNSLFEMQK